MHCPFCNHLETHVKDSRNNKENNIVRRRRICPKCNMRFTTAERVMLKDIFVIKRSGAKKPFDREKILLSITTAVRKRNVTEETLNKIVDHIVQEVEKSSKREIHSRDIGSMIMSHLAEIDEVAYIRFASVYRDFSSARDFAKFIGRLKK